MSSSVDAKSIYAFQATSLQGELVSLEQFRGQVLLVVNVASQCVFTAQYRELQSLYETYASKVFQCWDFPAISSVVRNREPAKKSPTSVQPPMT